MTQILNAQNGPYFDNIDLTANRDGDWFATDFEVLSLSCELTLGAAISGDLYAEFTADPARLKGISRVVLPAGCLFTNASGVTLPTALTSVNLASVASLATFSISVSKPGVGSMRWRWALGTGGGANPKIIGHMQASRDV